MLRDQDDPDPETRYQQALTLCALARLQFLLGKHGESEENYREGLEKLQRLADDAPGSPQYRAAWAHHRVDLGQVHVSLGRADRAEEAYHEVIRLCRERAGEYPPLRRELAYAYSRMASLPSQRLNETYYLKALETAEELYGEAPDDPAAQLDLAIARHNLGLYYYRTERHGEAETVLRRAVRLWEAMLRARPGARDVRFYLGESCMVLAAVLGARDLEEAVAMDRQALASREELVRKFPTAWQYQEGLARIRHNLAECCLTLGRLAEAQEQAVGAVAYRERAAALRPEGSGEHINLAEDLIVLGLIQEKNRQTDRAVAALERAIRLAEVAEARGSDVPRARLARGAALTGLGETLGGAGRPADALPLCNRGVEVLDDLHRKEPADGAVRDALLKALRTRATTLGQLGRHAEAAADRDRAAELAGPTRPK
jgi:tetratricopeptide (TPR) repeat protein